LDAETETLGKRSVYLRDRKLLACGACGWVHYAMTFQEKLTNDRRLARYNLTPAEQLAYQSAYRQCLRCEAPVAVRPAPFDRMPRCGACVIASGATHFGQAGAFTAERIFHFSVTVGGTVAERVDILLHWWWLL